jgi:23S rRNA (guanosine2251-2'-O)-methyltransferase
MRPGSRDRRPARGSDQGGKGRPPRSVLGGEQVEGRRAVLELLAAGRRRVREVVIADGLEPSVELDEISRLASRRGARISVVSHRRVDLLARTSVNQGVIAMATPIRPTDLDDLCQPDRRGTPPFLLVLDGVTDPQNLGALLRTAECAGISGVVLGRHRSAHITPTVTKAAAGAVEHLDISLVPGIPTALSRIESFGLRSIGLDPEGPRSLYDLQQLSGESIGGGVAIVLGDEGKGLSRLTRKRCAELVSIPIRGSIGSLNVAAAGAIACFEISRRIRGN